MTTATRPEVVLRLVLRGGNLALFRSTEPEVLLEGPAGTGKTFAACHWLHRSAIKYPGCRLLIARKTKTALTGTALVTLQNKVLDPREGVRLFGGSDREPPSFRYPNGSRIVVGGLDDPEKILSSEYDGGYINEATELLEEDWETLTSRMRNGVIPNPQLVGDCNPSVGSHWLNKRCNSEQTRRIVTHLEDNPAYYDDQGDATQEGQVYLGTLDRLTGTRYQRLRLGLWIGVENALYPHFDRELHVRELPKDVRFVDGAFGVDYGEIHKSAAVAVSVDQFGRHWVREAWAAPSEDHGVALKLVVGQMRMRYLLKRGRTDPGQGVLAGDTGGHVARRGPYRNSRIDIVGRLLTTFAGGRVPPRNVELWGKDRYVEGPYAEPDSPGLFFVKGAPGIEELCDQMEAYHSVRKVSDVKDELVIARVDEDMVAALEYACEELDAEPLIDPSRSLGSSTMPSSAAKAEPKNLREIQQRARERREVLNRG